MSNSAQITPSPKRDRVPPHFGISGTNVGGKRGERFFVVLRSISCRYAAEYGACLMCGFGSQALSKYTLSSDDLTRIIYAQFTEALSRMSDQFSKVSQVELLSIGSLLDDRQYPREFVVRSFNELARKKHVSSVLIESRTEFITTRRLQELKNALRSDQRLEIAVGVESCDESIRNGILRKRLPWKNLVRAIEICSDMGVLFSPYLLIKPPTVSEEDAALFCHRDAEIFVELAQLMNVQFRLLLQSVFVPTGSTLVRIWKAGQFQPPSLWTVLDATRRVSSLGPVFISLDDEGLSEGRKASSCRKCATRIEMAIEAFNQSQDPMDLEVQSCDCSA